MSNLNSLRRHLSEWQVDAVLVPHEDKYLNEYPPADAELLAWVSGFTGSAGMAVIGKKHAAMFVDGRYTIQAKKQLDSNDWESFLINDMPPQQWAKHKFKTIGYDPSCISAGRLEKMTEAFANEGMLMVPLPQSALHDLIPAITNGKNGEPVTVFPQKYEGRGLAEKLELIRAEMKAEGLDAALIADATLVSWLLGWRSRAVETTPVVLARALVTLDDVFVEIDPRHYDVPQGQVTLQNPLRKYDGIVGYDPNTTSASLLSLVTKPKPVKNLFEKLRCSKTPTSRKVIKEVLRRDNQILDKFFRQLQNYLKTNSAYEHEIAEMIAEARAKHPLYVEESFHAIVGFRENSAIIHYRPEKGSDKLVKGRGVLLVDCGGQYQDGTSDRTTTLLLGEPTKQEALVHKAVVKAHKALAATVFPEGTTGAELSAIPNAVLWAAGYTCPHGIGHGVGQYLSVHEGPFSISPRGTEKLPEGLLVSNEPGVYIEGKFGVRHERLYFVEKLKNGMMGFTS